MKHGTLLSASALFACLLASSTAVAQNTVERRSEPVPLLPGTQSDCDDDIVATTSTALINVGNTLATIDNGAASRNVIVTFSAEGATDPGEQMLVHFRIDGVIQAAVGPEFFAHDEPDFDAHTQVAVFNLGPGVHTIRPVFASRNGAEVLLGFRCLVLEGRTR